MKSMKCLRWVQARDREPVRSWVTLAAVFSMSFVVEMTQCCYGLWYDHLVSKYDTTKASVGLAYSIHVCIILVMAFAGPLVTKYGVKNVCFFGAGCSIIGNISCAFAPTIGVFIFLFGVVAGLGRVILFPLVFVEVQHVFSYNRGLATGIACLGYNMSDMISPILMAALLDNYGLTGTLLIHGAIQCHVFAFCLLYEDTRKSRQSEQSHDVHEQSHGVHEQSHDVHEQSHDVYDGFPTKTVAKMNGFTTNEDEKYLKSTDVLPKKMTAIENCKRLINLSALFTSTGMILLFLRITWMASKFAAITHIASAGMQYGLSAQHVAYMMSVWGFSSALATGYTTPFLNMTCVPKEVYVCVGMLILVTAATCALFGSVYNPFIFYAATSLFGVADSMGYPSYLLVVLKVVGPIEFHNMLLIIESLVALPALVIASWFCGWLVDITGDYLWVFTVSTVAAIMCLALTLTIAVHSMRVAKRTRTVELDDMVVDVHGDEEFYCGRESSHS